MSKLLSVGIDVSAATLDSALSDAPEQVVFLDTCANDPAAFAALAEQIETQARQRQCEQILLVIEPTGGYEQRLACFAYQRGWLVSLPNPYQVRKWAESQGIRAKTDRQDAQLLARYGLAGRVLLWQPLPEHVAVLSDLLDRRQDLEHMLRQERNRAHALKGQGRYYGPTQQSVERTLTRIETSLQEIEQAISEHIEQHDDLRQQRQLLRQVPGVGAKNVLPILALCARWSLLTGQQGSGKGLTSYVGLDPQPYESGRSVRKRASISRKGDPTIRQLLFMGALGGMRSKQSVLRKFYDRLLAAGKPKMVALIAAARKILVWAWAVFRRQVTFDPQLAQAKQGVC